MAQAAIRLNRGELARPRPITDTIGRTLIVVFLIKPVVDLFQGASIWFGPLRLSPTTFFGVAMAVWMTALLVGRGRHVPPFGRLWETFLAVNAISLVLGLVSGEVGPLPLVLPAVIKLIDAYVVFSAAYLAAQRYGYTEITPFVTAIVVGEAIVVFINVVVIGLGLGGAMVANPEFDAFNYSGRERGTYFDPGVLANVAFFSLVFTVVRYHLARNAKALWLAFTIVVVIADIYLIAVSQSRAAMLQCAIVFVIYLLFYQRSWGKIVAPVVVLVTIVVASQFVGSSYEEVFGRFESDIAALEAKDAGNVGVTSSGRVSLGKLEGLGSNRGMLWAEALTEIFERPFLELVIGNFSFKTGAHSDYIDVLARNGIVGLVVYLCLLFGLAARTFRFTRAAVTAHDRSLHFIAFSLIVCFMFYALPFRPLGYTTTAWYMWTMLAFSLAWGARRGRPATVTAQSAAAAPVAPGAEPAAEDEEDDAYGRRG